MIANKSPYYKCIDHSNWNYTMPPILWIKLLEQHLLVMFNQWIVWQVIWRSSINIKSMFSHFCWPQIQLHGDYWFGLIVTMFCAVLFLYVIDLGMRFEAWGATTRNYFWFRLCAFDFIKYFPLLNFILLNVNNRPYSQLHILYSTDYTTCTSHWKGLLFCVHLFVFVLWVLLLVEYESCQPDTTCKI